MFGRFDNSNLIMVYLLGVAFVATRYGRRPSVLAAVLSVAAFDFFFVPPYLTFAVSDTQYLVTFAVMLVVGLLISTLAVRVREQAEAAREREQRTQVLYAMSRELAGGRDGRGGRARGVAPRAPRSCRARPRCCCPDADGRLAAVPDEGPAGEPARDARSRSGRSTTAAAPGWAPTPCPARRRSTCRCRAAQSALGVLGVRPARVAAARWRRTSWTCSRRWPARRRSGLERVRLADEAERPARGGDASACAARS